ncbi:peptide chain release factor N(5)-glutamine methyltransferase [Gottschalkiaceae bacterium SANA]|nr:peptide chain release factor N(5)-glutamine methyltransferase [Gottschalkiaceae bacterium SANA]
MKIQNALIWGTEQLQQSLSPRLDAEILLAFLLRISRVYLMTHHQRELTDVEMDKFREVIAKRKTGYPIAYITGVKEFYGRDFSVQEEILIPRPETEHLIEIIVEWAKTHPVETIIDIGAGSGAIGITLGLELEETRVFATDISKMAVYMATENAKNHHLMRYLVLLGNLDEPLIPLELQEKVDVLVSNPPYIPKQEIDDLMSDVRDFEPHLALDGGEDGLDFYRALVKISKGYLRSGGLLAFEIGADQGQAVADLLLKAGYQSVAIHPDLAGLDRVVSGEKAQEP